MALPQKVYGINTLFLARIFSVHGIFDHHPNSPKTLIPQLEIGNLGGL